MSKEIKKAEKKEIQKLLDRGYFLAQSIIEVVGKPKEHVLETLMNLLKQLSEDERYKIADYDIGKPQKIKESKELYSAFADVEFAAKDEVALIHFATDYMPATVEVIEPSEMKVQASYTTHMLTEFVGRLHAVDMEFKKVKTENQLLAQNLGVMIKNALLIALNFGPQDVDRLSKAVGVDIDQTEVFLKQLEKDKKVAKEENMYRLL